MATGQTKHGLPLLPLAAADIVAAVMQQDRRILLFGPMGTGKSTLVMDLAAALAAAGRDCWCLNADPGSPAFGVPGAVSLARWQQSAWRVNKSAGLCTLDAGRFRLPLISALQALSKSLPQGMLLIDGPGVVRGVAGRELLEGLVQAVGVDVILALTAADCEPPLLDELRALPVELFLVYAATEAKRPGKRTRARQRTAQWDTYLADAIEQTFNLHEVNVTGMPPPREETHVWIGRQLALLKKNCTLALGEVQQLEDSRLTISVPAAARDAIRETDTLLIRDAARSAEGLVETSAPHAPERFTYLPPADVLASIDTSGGPRIAGHVGAVDVALVNGVFGDPLLHMRVRHQRRSLLFDLGEGNRLPARVAHQVSHVFISHAHMDHIGGFLWLMRSRLGDYPACRLYGPPGLAQHIAGFIQGVLWDRVQDTGPKFEVREFYDDRLQCFQLQAGFKDTIKLDDNALQDTVLLKERGYRVRGELLDHRGIPVMAYAFEPDKQINVRKDRLKSMGLEPGPWLNELKQHILNGNDNARIVMPDGDVSTAGELARQLVLITPGKKIVYATDFADTADNRQRIISLAQHAHTLFCEAAFCEADVDHAVRNGHLTTRACGEIATAAGVSRLIPFHFSRRYTENPQQLYDEIKVYCTRVVTPQTMDLFEAPAE